MYSTCSFESLHVRITHTNPPITQEVVSADTRHGIRSLLGAKFIAFVSVWLHKLNNTKTTLYSSNQTLIPRYSIKPAEQSSWFICSECAAKGCRQYGSFTAWPQHSLACLEGVMWLGQSEFLKALQFTFSKESFWGSPCRGIYEMILPGTTQRSYSKPCFTPEG